MGPDISMGGENYTLHFLVSRYLSLGYPNIQITKKLSNIKHDEWEKIYLGRFFILIFIKFDELRQIHHIYNDRDK